MENPIFTNDAIVFGLLMASLAFVFHTSSNGHKNWKRFYKIFPPLLMAYLIPSFLNSFGIISNKHSELYTMAKLYLLPASLVLMTLSIDLKAIMNLGPKSIIMFFTGTVGIMLGGPIAILIVSFFSPETVGGAGFDAVWRGLTTIAGSWIGGGANQAAMLEIYQYNPEKYGSMVLVDIIVANIWMAILLMGIGKTAKIDKWLNADSSAIEDLKNKVASYTASIEKMPSIKDYMIILGVGFGITGLAHMFADSFPVWLVNNYPEMSESSLSSSFFWLIVVSTTLGLILSFTKAKKLEGAGASKIGSVFIYVLVATIGMKMNVLQIFENPGLLAVGLIWMTFHVLLLIGVAKLIRAPYFFLTVGSQANVGGAASAPIVAAAFSPALAPVGVLLAVLGYAVGTYGAMFSAYLMEIASSF
ncbi:MAG: DUF819 family protein [Flavobacteriales bacterium]|nr:DUF819 family protein [Flavobacteriales bacterium]